MDTEKQRYKIKGRAAGSNHVGRFERHAREAVDDGWERDEELPVLRTQTTLEVPRSMISYNRSPDLPFDRSINPYRGCEHGCVYCYARNTHPFWGYSAGLDFERKVMVKKDAAKLLEKKIKNKRWIATPIMLSGNTDCYQPIEKELEITRSLLEVFWKYRHPVGIITKNSLILRDLDILKKLNKF